MATGETQGHGALANSKLTAWGWGVLCSKPRKSKGINHINRMIEMIIDKEFQALIPPLSSDEIAQLEANIVADGCRDPLVIWALPAPEPGDHKCYAHDESKCDLEPLGDAWHCRYCEHSPALQEYVIIDGHNRYEICTRLDINYDTFEVELDSRDEAIEWIINNQFGRRNLSDYQRGVLALRMKPIFEARALARQQGGQGGVLLSPKSDEATPAIRTDTAVAGLANLGKDTIRKIEHIEQSAAPEIKALTASGGISINLASQFVDLPVEAQQEAIAAIAENNEAAKNVLREAVHNHRAQGTGENEWYTPAQYVDSARLMMGGIDVDPASSELAQQTVQAGEFFTIDDDGLTREWNGRTWLNPPYAQPFIHQFMQKMVDEFKAGRMVEGIALTHNYTDTQWFHLAAKEASAICFTRGRIGFINPEGKKAAPTQGQAFFYFGDRREDFADEFCQFGFVLVKP